MSTVGPGPAATIAPSSQARAAPRDEGCGPTPEEPWPGRSHRASRWRVRAGTRRSKVAASSANPWVRTTGRSEEHTSELQSLMRISYAVFCLKKKKKLRKTDLKKIQIQNIHLYTS